MYQEGIDPSKDPSAKHYGHLSGPHQGKPASIWKARSQNDPTPNSPIPAIVDFDEANGGEWRKSFHGYPHGYAPGRMFSYRNTIYVQKIQRAYISGTSARYPCLVTQRGTTVIYKNFCT